MKIVHSLVLSYLLTHSLAFSSCSREINEDISDTKAITFKVGGLEVNCPKFSLSSFSQQLLSLEESQVKIFAEQHY